MNKNKIKELAFKTGWIVFLLFTICDYQLAANIPFLFTKVNIQASSVGVIVIIIIYLLTTNIKDWFNFSKDKFDRRTAILLGLLLIIAYVSSFLSEIRSFALSTTIFRLTLFFIVFTCCLGFVKQYRNAKDFMVKSFIYVNLVVVISSIADFYIPSFNSLLVEHFGRMGNHHSVLKTGGITYMRPSGLVTDINLTAYSITFSIILLLLNQKHFSKLFIWTSVILSGYSFGMLGSRSALVVIIISLIIFIIFKFTDRKKTLYIGIAFFLVQLVTPQTQARILQLFDKKQIEEEMTVGRPVIWKADIKAFKTSPVIGIGSAVFFKKSIQFISEVLIEEGKDPKSVGLPVDNQKNGLNPHNIFLAILVEYGVTGLIVFMVLLLHLFRYYLKEKLYITIIFFSGLLFVSALSNYAPYYKYYFVVCIIFYFASKQNMLITDSEE